MRSPASSSLGTFAVPLLAGLLVACSAASVSDPLSPRLGFVGPDGLGAAAIDSAGHWPYDPLSIDNAAVVGDSLVVTVTHGGGCAEHSYQLVVSTIWMESFPVQVPARISHDAHGDACKALLRKTLRISLAALASAYRDAYKTPHGSVALRLAGTTAGLVYSF